jgi:carboxypeptidase C (cathepsin A)
MRRIVLLAILLLPCLAMAQGRRANPAALPPASTTQHSIDLPGGKLAFTALVRPITLTNAAGVAQAEFVTTAFVADGAAAETRPVTFVFNGGPGAGSAWLNLGMVGPWRVRMDGAAAAPSAEAVAVDNPDTWLAFTDLVFIDPPGAGFGRLLGAGDEARKRFWAVEGDIDGLSETIRRWLQEQNRLASPKYVVGESYGGIRGPRVVRTLAMRQGVGVRGLVLVSPVFEHGGSRVFDPLSWVWALPTETAAARARKGPVLRADLADVEAYAAGDYVADLLRGAADPQAVARRVAKVAAFTGLDEALLRQRRAQVNNFEFSREHDRATARVDSLYDLTVSLPDAFPGQAFGTNPDPGSDALRAPLSSAMMDIYARRLKWRPEGVYEIENNAVGRLWDFGPGGSAQSFSALRTDLAADPALRVLVVHGLFDLVAPYFRSKVMLDGIEPSAGRDRVTFLALPGGHMVYARDESRQALTAAARALYPK